MRNARGAMLANGEEVSSEHHNPPPTKWARWSSNKGYRVVHGTRNRLFTPATKRERRKARKIAARREEGRLRRAA